MFILLHSTLPDIFFIIFTNAQHLRILTCVEKLTNVMNNWNTKDGYLQICIFSLFNKKRLRMGAYFLHLL